VIKPDKLVLIASSGVRKATSLKKTFHKILAKIAKTAIFLLPKKTQHKIKKRLYTKIGSDYMVMDGLQETFKKVVSYDVLADARKIKTPTLLIYGNTDLITPISQAETIAGQIRNSKLEVIDKAGHFPHKDKPEDVKKIIEAFLK